MRLLLVNSHGADPTYGGAERYVGDLARGLGARGHHVEVLSAFPQRGDPAVQTHVLHKVDWRENRLRRIRNQVNDVVSAPWPGVAALLRDLNPDLVHTNNLPGIGTGVWATARRLGLPVVHTVHDHYLLCPRTTLVRPDGSQCQPHPLLCGARTRRLARWHEAVRAVIAPSDYILRVHGDLFAGATEHVIGHPLEPLGGPPAKPPGTPRTLGYVGALTTIKGIGLLLDAAPSLAREGLILRVAGEGPLRREVEAADHVHYEGWLPRDELGAFMVSCDVGLVPSLCNEARPYVVCEWLAAARPVLATRRGGLIEATPGGGVLTFDESPAGLLDAVLRLRAEEEWRRVVATVPVVTDDRDTRRWLNEHEAVYEAVLQRIAAPAPA